MANHQATAGARKQIAIYHLPMTIRTVDLRHADAADQLDVALRGTGFVKLVGHGVKSGAQLWSVMDELFAQPTKVKMTWVSDEPLANRGYRARGSESLAYSLGQSDLPPDLFESFNVRHDDRAGNEPLLARSLWPAEVPSFRPVVEAYLAEMSQLAYRLDELIGGLLGLPDLPSRSIAGPDAMACLRYQSSPDERTPAPDQARMGAHSDYTSFTILNADPVAGLEILDNTGWIPVAPDPGTLLLNVGDLAAIWTNDVWPSTVHRVPLRGDGTDPPLRRSVAYFHYPNLDTLVEPLDAFVNGEPHYKPVTVRDHLSGKLVGPKIGRQSEGAVTLGERSL